MKVKGSKTVLKRGAWRTLTTYTCTGCGHSAAFGYVYPAFWSEPCRICGE